MGACRSGKRRERPIPRRRRRVRKGVGLAAWRAPGSRRGRMVLVICRALSLWKVPGVGRSLNVLNARCRRFPVGADEDRTPPCR